jgi:hypothetical protein
MSEDQTYGEASVESAQGYAPMADAYAPPEDKKKTYDGNNSDSIREAAKDLTEARAKAELEPTPRGYVQYGGDHHLEASPENETISLERAADDLTRQRGFEQAAAQSHDPDRMAAAVDSIRAAHPDRQLPPDLIPQLQAAHEQATKQEQSQAQATEQPVEQPLQQPMQQPPLPDGVDPEIAQALQNPKIRAALEAEVMAAENARQQFSQATLQASKLAAAAVLAQHPELASLSPQEMPHALAAIEKINPQKAAEIQSQLSRAKGLMDAHLQVEQQRAVLQAQQLQAWVAQEDQKFSQATKHESPETMRKLSEAAVELAEEYGVSKAELLQLWNSQPLLRSSAMQRIFADAARFRIAQKGIAEKAHVPVPPVQRPGVSQPRGDYAGVQAALKSFNADPSPKAAAALLMARRAANSRR